MGKGAKPFADDSPQLMDAAQTTARPGCPAVHAAQPAVRTLSACCHLHAATVNLHRQDFAASRGYRRVHLRTRVPVGSAWPPQPRPLAPHTLPPVAPGRNPAAVRLLCFHRRFRRTGGRMRDIASRHPVAGTPADHRARSPIRPLALLAGPAFTTRLWPLSFCSLVSTVFRFRRLWCSATLTNLSR
jgi:hypothetical protein